MGGPANCCLLQFWVWHECMHATRSELLLLPLCYKHRWLDKRVLLWCSGVTAEA